MQALEAQRDRRRGRALPDPSGPLVLLGPQRLVGPSHISPEGRGEGDEDGDRAGGSQGPEGLEKSEWGDGGGQRRRGRNERGGAGPLPAGSGGEWDGALEDQRRELLEIQRK